MVPLELVAIFPQGAPRALGGSLCPCSGTVRVSHLVEVPHGHRHGIPARDQPLRVQQSQALLHQLDQMRRASTRPTCDNLLGELRDTQTIPIHVAAVNDTPQWSAPPAQLMAREDEELIIRGVQVQDVDARAVDVVKTTTDGSGSSVSAMCTGARRTCCA